MKTILIALFFASTGLAQNFTCGDLFRIEDIDKSKTVVQTPVMRSLSDIVELVFMTFNVENFFLHKGKFEHDVPGKMRQIFGRGKEERPKSHMELEWIIKIIEEKNPDVITVQEVESLKALEEVAKRLGGKYRALLIEGNDARGIDVGFLVKVDLPLDIQLKTNKDLMWLDPTTGKNEKLFSRDLPVLEFRLKKEQVDPSFVLVGNHAKSKRDRPNDPNSVMWRSAQYEKAAEIVGGYVDKGIRVLFGGDFNIDIAHDHEADPLKRYLTSAFDFAQKTVEVLKRITHTFHPNGEPAHKAQMDDFWASQDLRGHILSAEVVPYKYGNGNEMPIPETYEERQKQPSDHRPVLIRVLAKVLFGI
jgi:hypothetical protein